MGQLPCVIVVFEYHEYLVSVYGSKHSLQPRRSLALILIVVKA
jgi:hypothetical protein